MMENPNEQLTEGKDLGVWARSEPVEGAVTGIESYFTNVAHIRVLCKLSEDLHLPEVVC
jgi:hypothetical protein